MQPKYDTLAIKYLQEWMREHKKNIQALSIMMESQYALIWNYIRGRQRPGLEKAVKFEEITNGYVKCKDWLIFPAKVSSKKSLLQKKKKAVKGKKHEADNTEHYSSRFKECFAPDEAA